MVYYRTLNIVPCVNTLGSCCLSILYISSSLKFFAAKDGEALYSQEKQDW